MAFLCVFLPTFLCKSSRNSAQEKNSDRKKVFSNDALTNAYIQFVEHKMLLFVFVCLILFFTSTQQSFSYAGRFFLGLTSTKLG